MISQNPVGSGVAEGVQRDAVDAVRIVVESIFRNPVGFDQLQVERHARIAKVGVVGQKDEGFSVLASRHPQSAELLGEMHRFLPAPPVVLDSSVEAVLVRQHLQPRAGTDRIVRQGEHDALGIGVVGHFVAGAGAKNLPHRRVRLGVGREEVGERPVLGVVARGLRGVVAAARVAARVGVLEDVVPVRLRIALSFEES